MKNVHQLHKVKKHFICLLFFKSPWLSWFSLSRRAQFWACWQAWQRAERRLGLWQWTVAQLSWFSLVNGKGWLGQLWLPWWLDGWVEQWLNRLCVRCCTQHLAHTGIIVTFPAFKLAAHFNRSWTKIKHPVPIYNSFGNEILR
jgi:hypothetical protein